MKKILLVPPTGSTGKDLMITIPSSIGAGSIKTIHLNSGIRLVIGDYRLKQLTIFESGASGPFFGFGFCLSGNIESHPPCFKESFLVKTGQSGFFSFPEMTGHTENIGLKRVIRVSILMDPSLISDFMAGYPDQFMTALIKASKTSCRFADTITPPMQGTLDQILNCPYHGLIRKFFIEGKVMELIAYKIEQLEQRNQQNQGKTALTSNDIDCVHHAAQLLRENLGNAPDLNELARSVGMCRSKLHCSFRTVYGITPFDYLRNRRLETAWHLLNEGKMNVTETSYTVGYASLSHFSKAFKQYFGCPPGKCFKKYGHPFEMGQLLEDAFPFSRPSL